MGIILFIKNKIMAGKAKRQEKKASQKKSVSAKNKSKGVRMEVKVGLSFPCGRVKRHAKQTRVAKRVSSKTGVFTSAVMEYIMAEVLELAGNVCKEKKMHTIFPKHLQTAIRSDEELDDFLKNVTLRSTHVLPHIEEALLPKKKNKVSQ